MPDTPTLTLILFVGVAVGALLTLLVDNASLDRRVQEEKTQALRLENKANLAETQMKHLREELADAEGWRDQTTRLLQDKEELEQKLETAESQVGRLDAQVKGTLLRLTETQKMHKQITTSEAEIRNLNARLKEAKNQLVFLRLEGKQDLTLVRGIGPAYARRLHEANIKTLTDLAQAEPAYLRQVVQLKAWQNAEPEEWIAEAKELAAVFGDEEE
jgi:predicted flap endonuclease-1-like 5' DNA nuclease